MSGPRVLRRPPNGWDRRPNSQLGDLVGLVALLFAGAAVLAGIFIVII